MDPIVTAYNYSSIAPIRAMLTHRLCFNAIELGLTYEDFVDALPSTGQADAAPNDYQQALWNLHSDSRKDPALAVELHKLINHQIGRAHV